MGVLAVMVWSAFGRLSCHGLVRFWAFLLSLSGLLSGVLIVTVWSAFWHFSCHGLVRILFFSCFSWHGLVLFRDVLGMFAVTVWCHGPLLGVSAVTVWSFVGAS